MTYPKHTLAAPVDFRPISFVGDYDSEARTPRRRKVKMNEDAASANHRPNPPSERTHAADFSALVLGPRVDEGILRRILSGIDDFALVVLDSGGLVTDWNEGARRMFGYTEAEIIGQHFSRFYGPEELLAGKPADDLRDAAQSQRLETEVPLLRKNGTDLWAILQFTPIESDDDARFRYAMTVRDITVRKRKQDVLRMMVEVSLNAIVLVDARGEILSVNSQTEKIFGYTRDRLIGQSVDILVPDRFRAEHPKNRNAFFADPVVRPMGAGRDLYGRRSDGSEFPVEIGLCPIETADGPAVVGSIVDITERKRAEERFRLAVESAPNAMVMINREGRIVLVNLQTERLFGYSREELLGGSVERLVPDRYQAEHPNYRRAFFDKPVTRAMGIGRELYGRRKDGSEFPVEIGLNPIDTGDEMLVLSAIVDITARKDAETRAQKHLADLAHVARLSTVGQMFSELAHEINQPLGAAANYARACVIFAKTGEGASQEQMIDWMEKTAEQTNRAIEIVLRLGAFVKKDAGVRTRVNVNRLIEKVLSLSEHTMRAASETGEPIRLELKLDPSMPDAVVDIVQIEQVLLNLIRNAIEAMQEAASPLRKLTVATYFDAEFIHAAVCDTGPGIKPDDLARLFDPYFTTKSTGMGLGLSISRSIIEDHEGDLDAVTSPAGTTFHFSLPIAKAGPTL